jgi:hypothetical protein
MVILEQIAPTAVDHSVPGTVAASSLPNAFEATSAESHADGTDVDSIISSAYEHRALETWPHKKEFSVMVGLAHDSQGSGVTNVADQLDFLGDTMLAEVEAAWAAEGRGDGFNHGAIRLGADAFGAHELPQLPNLDILSERCSLELSEGFDRKHDGQVDGRYSCVESILRRGSGVECEIEEDGYALTIKRPGGNVMWGEFTARGNEERHKFRGVAEVELPIEIGRGGTAPEVESNGSSRVGDASAKHMENAGGEAASGPVQVFLNSYGLALDIKEEDERGVGGATMKPILNVLQSGKQVLMAASESRMQPRKEHGAMQQVGTGEALTEQTGGCLERSPILTGGVNRGRGTRFQLLPQARLSSTSACPTPPALSSAFRLQSLKRPVLGGGSSRGPVGAPRSHVWGQKPRMHLTPQQRKILHGFGTDVSWVGPGVERMEEAHQICKSMRIDMRQLKKWICNHRPRRFRRPAPELGVPLPCVILPPTAKSEVYGGAAHGNAGLKQSVSKGAELHQGEGQWGTRPAGGAAEDGGGGEQGPVDMAHFATAGNLRQIMGRKMKDFDPRKVCCISSLLSFL